MNKTIRVGGATVTCVQASECSNTGKPIFTLECEYPRAIHAQLLTHGVFSKNSSSTRAVPLKAAIAQVRANPAQVVWTENQAGMQGRVITEPVSLDYLERFKLTMMNHAISYVETLAENGVHKQNAGRYLEPFQNIKIVLTSTEWDNWDWLRFDPDAQGEIADLARAMKEARDSAEVMILNEGEWHVPYVERLRSPIGKLYYRTSSEDCLSVEEAKAVSSSVCAQISYRKADDSLEKALKMRGMLVDGRKVHASPFEHQATPIPELPSNTMVVSNFLMRMPEGVTHIDRDATPCSGNLKQWIQYRQLIPNHDKAIDNG